MKTNDFPLNFRSSNHVLWGLNNLFMWPEEIERGVKPNKANTVDISGCFCSCLIFFGEKESLKQWHKATKISEVEDIVRQGRRNWVG